MRNEIFNRECFFHSPTLFLRLSRNFPREPPGQTPETATGDRLTSTGRESQRQKEGGVTVLPHSTGCQRGPPHVLQCCSVFATCSDALLNIEHHHKP